MKIKSLVQRLFLATGLAITGSFLTGCEEQESYVAEGCADVRGTWHKPPAGVTSTGWEWHWGNLYLDQEGTKVSGTEQWEFYNPQDVSGNITSNRLHLDIGDWGESLEGVVEGDVFRATKIYEHSDGTISRFGGYTYTRISSDVK